MPFKARIVRATQGAPYGRGIERNVRGCRRITQSSEKYRSYTRAYRSKPMEVGKQKWRSRILLLKQTNLRLDPDHDRRFFVQLPLLGNI